MYVRIYARVNVWTFEKSHIWPFLAVFKHFCGLFGIFGRLKNKRAQNAYFLRILRHTIFFCGLYCNLCTHIRAR